MGWQVGDVLGIAKTTGSNKGEQVTIKSVEQFKVTIDKPLEALRWGGIRNVEGYDLEMASEVINLSRNILITGDYDRFDKTNNGFHTLTVKGEGRNVYDIRYARFENCGQVDLAGKYCTHFHYAHICPNCILKGNAYENAIQSSITVHGTHQSTGKASFQKSEKLTKRLETEKMLEELTPKSRKINLKKLVCIPFKSGAFRLASYRVE